MDKGVLFLTDSYFYSPSPNGLCVERISKVLKLQNINVSVVAMRNQYIQKFEVIDGVDVYRAKSFPEWELMYDSKKSRVCKKIGLFFYRVKNFFLSFLYPIRAKEVADDMVSVADKIIKEKNIGTIVAVYRDAECVSAGLQLKLRYPNIKLIVYTLDSISGGVCSNPYISKKKHIKKCRKFERKILGICDYFCPMLSHKALIEKEFPDFNHKIKYMDVPSFLINNDEQGGKVLNFDDIHFVFTGNMTKTNADSSYFLNLLPLLSQKLNFHVDIYGGMGEDLKNIAVHLGVWNKSLHFFGNVTQNELVEIRKNADVFLNFGNEHPCGIPCKIFEYLSAERPIISFYKIEEDASRAYLKDDKYVLLISEKESQEVAIEKIIEFLHAVSGIVRDRKLLLEQYKENTPYPMANVIVDCCQGC